MSKSRKQNPYKKDFYQDGDRQHKMVLVKERGKKQWKNHLWEDEIDEDEDDDFFSKLTEQNEE